MSVRPRVAGVLSANISISCTPFSSVKRRSPATMFTTDAMQDLEIQGGIQQMDGDESNSIMREALHSKFKYIIDSEICR